MDSQRQDQEVSQELATAPCYSLGCKSHRTILKEAKVHIQVDTGKLTSELCAKVSHFLGFYVFPKMGCS